MSDTPITDAAMCQYRYREKRGPWEGDEVLLYVEPEAARHLEQDRAELLKALRTLELAANTVSACYTRNPGNFAAALQDIRGCAAEARDLIYKLEG
jgi:hypothetical protein